MPTASDYYKALVTFSATVKEKATGTWDTTSPDVAYGGTFNAAVLFFGEPDVIGNISLVPDQRSMDGLAITAAELFYWGRQYYGGYAGYVYPLDAPVAPEAAWWLNIEPRLGKQMCSLPAPTSEGYQQYTQPLLPALAQGETTDFTPAILAVKNGIAIRARFGSTILINQITVIANERDANAVRHPYIRFTAALVLPWADDLSPAFGYLDPRKEGVLSWRFAYDKANVWGNVWQNGARVQIRPVDTVEIIEYTVSGLMSTCTVPANTRDTDYDWRVAVTSMHNVESAFSDWCRVSIVDSLSSTRPLAPVNTLVDVATDTWFTWVHGIDTGTLQTGYEIQYSTNGVQWAALATGTGTVGQHTILAGTLPGGNGFWRVRTMNADGVLGNWSTPAPIVVQSPPDTPSIVSVAGTTSPTVSWQGAGQQGFEVMVNGVSTGTMYGTDKSYVWPDILPDGAHTIAVRIVNRFSLWSTWTHAPFIVKNVPGVAQQLFGTVRNYGIVLRWDDHVSAQVYCDGVRIVDAVTSPFVHHTACGKHTYFLRVAHETGYYTDSNRVTLTLQVRDAAIAVEGTWDWIPLIWNENDFPPMDTTHTPVYALNHYSGRSLPAVEMSIHRTVSHKIAYALHDSKDRARLVNMLGCIVWYRRGDSILRGLLSSIGESFKWWGWAETLSIEEVSQGASRRL